MNTFEVLFLYYSKREFYCLWCGWVFVFCFVILCLGSCIHCYPGTLTLSFSVLCELWSVWKNGFLLFHYFFHYYSSILKFHLGIFVFMEFECLLKWFTVLVLGCESSVNFSFSAELIIFHECSSLSVSLFLPNPSHFIVLGYSRVGIVFF